MTVDPAYLHRPVDDWPLILAGPIVRRVTRTSAAVFLAARESFTVTLRLNDGVGPGSERIPGAMGTATSVALGRSLHVCVVEANELDLQPGVVYGYDVEIEASGDTHTLGSLGLLSSAVALGYTPGNLPGFLLPGSVDDVRVVQSSCRKLHGGVEGTGIEPDALPIVDRLIGDNLLDTAKRPQQLLLTGDQLYSDDVPAAVLAAATSLSHDLLSWGSPEVYPDKDEAEQFTDDHIRLRPGNRSEFLDSQGVKDRPPGVQGLSDYAASHLLFLGEWYAAYLMTWSPELWQTRDAVDPDDRAGHPDHSFYVLPETADVLVDRDVDEEGEDIEPPDTTTAALVFAQSLPFVRRALANVATYMAFDDHDVTDDWFLDLRVSEQMRGRGEVRGPCGRRLMRNALAAYAVFQHWGNAPEQFTGTMPGAALLDLLDAQSPSAVDDTPLLGQAGHEEDADVILDVGAFPLGIALRDERMRWDYELVFDSHRLLVLDTRTWRGYPTDPPELDPAALLAALADRVDIAADWGPDALEELADAWSAAVDDVADVAVDLSRLIQAGSDLLGDSARFARAIESEAANAQALGETLVETATGLLDAVLTADAMADFAAVETALAAAREALIVDADADPADPLPDAFRVASALNAAVFAIRAGLADWLRAVGLATLTPPALAVRAQIDALATLLGMTARFLQGASVSLARAARNASAMADAWLTLAAGDAGALWGADGEAASDALDAAAAASAAIQSALGDAAAEYRGTIDPLWDIIVGKGSKRLNAQLISLDALAFEVVERVANPDSRRELTLVVSPAPVLGHWLVELIQRAMLLQTEVTAGDADTEQENEPWSGNIPAWAAFLDALTALESVVFLSGDVHYAFSTVNDYCPRDSLDLCRFIQLTSSPTKNLTANSILIEEWDETSDDFAGMLHLQFDFMKLLPTAEELVEYPLALVPEIPSAEDAEQALNEQIAQVEDAGTDLWSWATDWDFSFQPLVDKLNEEQQSAEIAWDDLKVWWRGPRPEIYKRAQLLPYDPLKALVGDRLLSEPLLQEQSLLLLQSLGIDPEQLVETDTTVLRDLRADERLDDSPGLRARIEELLPHERKFQVRRGRATIARHNIGVVSTQATPLGRFVIHDLHWFPLDEQERQTDPSFPGAAFRDDWIITRHIAGLRPGMPADGQLAGVVPGQRGAETEPEGELEIEVTSPRQSASGAASVHPIAFDGPSMPALTVNVTIPGLSGEAASRQTRDVRLAVTYAEGNRNDAYYLPGPGPDDWQPLDPGVEEWQPVLTELAGGDLQVFARATIGGQSASAETGPADHRIWGENPPKATVRDEAARGDNFLVVFHRESRFTQFSDDASTLNRYRVGPYTVLRAPDNGFGLGQLTIPAPTRRECWDWKAAVAGALARLDGFRADALTYQAQVQQGLPWDAATGRLGPAPPNEGQAFPDAPAFTDDQLDLEMYCRYNSGRRFHDYDQAGGTWVRQPSQSAGLDYATEVLAVRQAVDAGNLPGGW